jgi:glutamate--cysteine ligase
MDYSAQNVESIAQYIKSGEKKPADCAIGTEFEHILLYKDSLKSVAYNDEKGITSVFGQLQPKGWEPIFENQQVLGAARNGDMITLEPGGQVEISVHHTQDIREIEGRYLRFLEEIKPILEGNGQRLMALGYHPVSRIEEIPFIPKRRYAYMAEYLSQKDRHGLNMMKGTASTQVVIDYTDEEDFIRKYRVANSLTVVLAYLFDNTPIFEGQVWDNNLARTHIWNHVDVDRSGVLEGSLDDPSFGYKAYASYVWNKPMVIGLLDGDYVFTKERTMKEVYEGRLMKTEEIEHALSMFFPDVRVKRYIEIRMCDSVPYPWNLALSALVKGIFYHEKNLAYYVEAARGWSEDAIQSLKETMISQEEVPEALKKQAEELLIRAMDGLTIEEKAYLKPLQELFYTHGNLATWIKKSIKEGLKDPFEKAFAT